MRRTFLFPVLFSVALSCNNEQPSAVSSNIAKTIVEPNILQDSLQRLEVLFRDEQELIQYLEIHTWRTFWTLSEVMEYCLSQWFTFTKTGKWETICLLNIEKTITHHTTVWKDVTVYVVTWDHENIPAIGFGYRQFPCIVPSKIHLYYESNNIQDFGMSEEEFTDIVTENEAVGSLLSRAYGTKVIGVSPEWYSLWHYLEFLADIASIRRKPNISFHYLEKALGAGSQFIPEESNYYITYKEVLANAWSTLSQTDFDVCRKMSYTQLHHNFTQFLWWLNTWDARLQAVAEDVSRRYDSFHPNSQFEDLSEQEKYHSIAQFLYTTTTRSEGTLWNISQYFSRLWHVYQAELLTYEDN